MPIPPRLEAIYRQLGWPEKLFLVLLASYTLVVMLAPASTLRPLAQMALTVAGILAAVRLLRNFIKKALWRLRNRLVIAYLLIAVVPVVLILALVGIGTYWLIGQIAVFLVTSELDHRAEALVGPAQGLATTPRQDLEGQLRWMAPYYQQRYEGLELLVRNRGEMRFPETSELELPPEGWSDASGIVYRDGRLQLWAYAAGAETQALLVAPLTSEILDGLIPDLGHVNFVDPAALEHIADRERRPAQVAVSPSRQARRDRLPPPVSRLDIEVTWFSLIPIAIWDSPGRVANWPLGVTSRPSAVLRTLFRQAAQGIWLTLFLMTAGLLLLVELVSLFIGVSMTRTITGAVHNIYEGTRRIMEGDFSHRIEVRGNDQLAQLGTSFNRMTENLERLLAIEKEKERLQSELEIAREVQNQLYPKSVPSLPRLELSALCHPARMVSGDYYDYLALQNSRLALAVGDVAGKGISAALLMATVQSSLRTQIRACMEVAAAVAASGGRAAYDAVPAARLVSQLNQQLYAFTSAEKFATFFFGVYDDHSGLLTYTNAGHPPPVLIRGEEALRLEPTGMVVGAFPFAEYRENTVELGAGDLLVCFTDGITEPENEYGEMFSEQALIEVVLRNSWRKPQDIIASVLAAVHQWTNSPELQDDMTLLVARRL